MAYTTHSVVSWCGACGLEANYGREKKETEETSFEHFIKDELLKDPCNLHTSPEGGARRCNKYPFKLTMRMPRPFCHWFLFIFLLLSINHTF